MNTLLTLGSVVRLKDAKKSLMIIGNKIKNKDNEIFDYIGVMHPEGYVDNDTFFLFNQDDVEEIKYIGFLNADVQVFREKYKEELRKNKF